MNEARWQLASRMAGALAMPGYAFRVNGQHQAVEDEKSARRATEFVGTSLISDGPDYERCTRLRAENPSVRFFDSRPRG